MKKSSILFGTFFISLGLISIIHNYIIPVNFNYINYIWQFLFIIWGISFFKLSDKFKIILAIVAGLIAGYYFYGVFANARFECNYKDTVNLFLSQIPANYL
ncbi:MAG TPA: hypothetical protein PLU67_09665 [Candidatus Kapabacteria bacterium]|jgi:hypothetical protein|nr:hypothetical protein [Candidatus Kapabacteria bacterium]HPU22944.1 hypothetical protein [Candidatus Kapabacteria bacterium]